MDGHVSLDKETDLLLITFNYSPQLVELVKKIPRRRWDPTQKQWLAPATEAAEAIRLLRPRGFTFTPEVEDLAGQEPSARPGSTPETAFTVSQLNHAVATAIQQSFARPLWLVAEMDRLLVRGSGHCYLELLEKDAGREGMAASVPAVIFAPALGEIEARLVAQGGGLELKDGLEVRLLVKPDLYPQRGRFQVIVQDIDPTFTLGRLAARREEILRELDKLGLRDRNSSLPYPLLPLRIALITSEGSNAATDFLGVLQASGLGFQVDLLDARMQGQELEEQVCRGLDRFARRAQEYDVLVIARGGGSPADLAWFDNLKLATALARLPLKALIGIGHSQDQGVLDRIAASAATPTAAAERLVDLVEEERARFDRLLARLADRIKGCLEENRRELARSGRRLALATGGRLREEGVTLAQIGQRVMAQVSTAGRREREVLAFLAGQVQRASRRLARRRREELDQLALRLKDHDPGRILSRGFALVRDELQRVLKHPAQTRPGAPLKIELAQGTLKARVDEEHEQNK